MSMPCPKCGGRLSITNTAGVDSNRTYLLGRIAPFIEWYSDEFVARDRRCVNPKCGYAMLTVELDLNDFVGAIRYAKIDGPALTASIIDWATHIQQNGGTHGGARNVKKKEDAHRRASASSKREERKGKNNS